MCDQYIYLTLRLHLFSLDSLVQSPDLTFAAIDITLTKARNSHQSHQTTSDISSSCSVTTPAALCSRPAAPPASADAPLLFLLACNKWQQHKGHCFWHREVFPIHASIRPVMVKRCRPLISDVCCLQLWAWPGVTRGRERGKIICAGLLLMMSQESPFISFLQPAH